MENIFLEDTMNYPYFIYYPFNEIPMYQRISVEISTMNLKRTHLVSITDFQKYIDNLYAMEIKNTLGILPRGIIPYATTFYFKNQRIRWAFKKLWNRYQEFKSGTLIFNTEDLQGNPITYNPKRPSRRVLSLWDNSSKRKYLFSITDILGILRACIMGAEIHQPKNPYTNIVFTMSQIRRIHMFLQSNMDRLQHDDSPILTYTRWLSKELTYDHITQKDTYHGSLHVKPPEDPMIASLLWNTIVPPQNVIESKRDISIELRDELFRQTYFEFVTSTKSIPTTKAGYYIRMTLLNSNTDYPGELLRNWYNTNKKRHTIRYNRLRNHPSSE
jgi:hypothetical protein